MEINGKHDLPDVIPVYPGYEYLSFMVVYKQTADHFVCLSLDQFFGLNHCLD